MENVTLLELFTENNTVLNTEGSPVNLGELYPYAPDEKGMVRPTYTKEFNLIDNSMLIDDQLFLDYGTGNSKLHDLVSDIDGNDMLKARLDKIIRSKAGNEQYLFCTAGYACVSALVSNTRKDFENLAILCKVAQSLKCPYVANAIAGVFMAKEVTKKEKGEGYKVLGIPNGFIKSLSLFVPSEHSVLEYARRIQDLFFPTFIPDKVKQGKEEVICYYGVTRTWDNKHISEINKFFFQKEELETEELKANIDKLLKQFDKYFANNSVKQYAFEAMEKYIADHSGNIAK